LNLSPDGKNLAVHGPDGKWGVWPFEGNAIRPIPGLDSNYYVFGWSADGGSVYAGSIRTSETTAKVYGVNTETGKMELWRTLGSEASAGVDSVGFPHFASGGTAYAYSYVRVLSEAYVVTGLQ
jgi:WD40 repeat protein